jgi:hypothetical protein
MTDHAPQNARHHSAKIDLRTVARRAMMDRGLAPDFSNSALDETAAIVKAGAAPNAPTEALKDMRQLLWASIDNDDSRDLDQLSVAESLANGACSSCSSTLTSSAASWILRAPERSPCHTNHDLRHQAPTAR